MFLGEIISIIVCISWTACALFGQVAVRGIGNALPLNVLRMALSLLLLSASIFWVSGSPYPLYADGTTWLWLSMSGLVGYVFGDYCLYNAYILIGARLGQLLMTLAPPAAAFTGWLLLGEKMSGMALLGMTITVTGIAISILGKEEESKKLEKSENTECSENSENPKESKNSPTTQLRQKFPLAGILYGVGAGIGQGVGLVLSKIGIEHYEQCIETACQNDPTTLSTMLEAMPMSATLIRTITGIIGFTLALFYTRQQATLVRSVRQGRLMFFVLLATITGPFIGVSLSLKATLYTSTGIAQTIMACTPILILWPSRIFFKQRICMSEVVGAAISVGGVALFFV